MKAKTLKEKYQAMLEWNQYRLVQNQESLERLQTLLLTLGTELEGDAGYVADVEDLQSLRLIYETSLRNFEGKITMYNHLIEQL